MNLLIKKGKTMEDYYIYHCTPGTRSQRTDNQRRVAHHCNKSEYLPNLVLVHTLK